MSPTYGQTVLLVEIIELLSLRCDKALTRSNLLGSIEHLESIQHRQREKTYTCSSLSHLRGTPILVASTPTPHRISSEPAPPRQATPSLVANAQCPRIQWRYRPSDLLETPVSLYRHPRRATSLIPSTAHPGELLQLDMENGVIPTLHPDTSR